MTEIQKSKQCFVMEGLWSLNIGICGLFEIWCLEFVILDTRLRGRAIIFDPRYSESSTGSETRVFKSQIIGNGLQDHLVRL